MIVQESEPPTAQSPEGGLVARMTKRAREAQAFYRRRGRGGFRNSVVSYLRARWALRAASYVGTVRLLGGARVTNGGEMIFEDRVRLDGRLIPLSFSCFQGGRLRVGEGTFINFGTDISANLSVDIGRNCDIGQYAIIMDSDYHSTADHHQFGDPQPVVIEDDVWIAARVTILPGAHIGRGSVIGAHAVVKGEIPPYSMAVGVPARVVRTLSP
jgi:maltose O-acetyltransferase